jgi:hypothetical protein
MSGTNPIATEIGGQAQEVMEHLEEAGRAYRLIMGKSAQQLKAEWDGFRNQSGTLVVPPVEIGKFYSAMEQVMNLSRDYLERTGENQIADLDDTISTIYEAEAALNTPMAIALTSMFMIETQVQGAQHLLAWKDTLNLYTDYFEIPLNIRIHFLNSLATIDLSDPDAAELIQSKLSGWVANSREGSLANADIFQEPGLMARVSCIDRLEKLRRHCHLRFSPGAGHVDPVRLRTVTRKVTTLQAIDPATQVASLTWTGQANLEPVCTDLQHRDVINYLHTWCLEGRGVEIRVPMMMGYFDEVTAAVNLGVVQGTARIERLKKHMTYSLQKDSGIPESIWLPDTMWSNLDAVLRGCVDTGRNLGEAPDGGGWEEDDYNPSSGEDSDLESHQGSSQGSSQGASQGDSQGASQGDSQGASKSSTRTRKRKGGKKRTKRRKNRKKQKGGRKSKRKHNQTRGGRRKNRKRQRTRKKNRKRKKTRRKR